MHNPLFKLESPLTPDAYLIGAYSWSEIQRLQTAVLICQPPTAGEFTLTLEVAGALTNKSFTVTAGDAAELRQTLFLGIKLPAGQTVRWRVTAASAEVEAAPTAVAITLQSVRDVDAVAADPELTVWWRNGLERLLLFVYAPDTAAFAEAVPGLATGRAAITAGAGVFTITIQAAPVLRVASHTLYLNALTAGGWDAPAEPRLEFRVAGQPIATLTASGKLFVAGANEQTPVDQTGQFLLGTGAALNAAGVLATRFEQPL